MRNRKLSTGISALIFSLILVSPALAASLEAKKLLAEQKKADQEREAAVSTQQQPNGHRWVKARILIKAQPHVVWEAVHEERSKDPDLAYSKVLSQDKNETMLEQKFSLIPVIGTAVCVMKDIEVPNESIAYTMVKSDHFKAFEGRWELSPGSVPDSTYLELASYCDMGLPIPRGMIEGVTAKKLQRRLSHVRDAAESMQNRLAHANKPE